MSDEEKWVEALARLAPLLPEFDAIIAHAFRDDPKMLRWRTQSYHYDTERMSVRPSTHGVPEGQGMHPKDPVYWMPDRRLTVELAARTIEHRSRRSDGLVVMPHPEDWKDRLREQYPGMFDCEISIGSGWADLVRAYVEMRLEAGDHFRFTRITEKYGSLRLDDTSDDSPLESVADHLSTCICEECGAPGRERDDGWIRTLCDEHAAAWGRR
jgi:hypothetical protein